MDYINQLHLIFKHQQMIINTKFKKKTKELIAGIQCLPKESRQYMDHLQTQI